MLEEEEEDDEEKKGEKKFTSTPIEDDCLDSWPFKAYWSRDAPTV